MKFKDLPSWLKGGIVAGAIPSIAYLSFWLFLLIFKPIPVDSMPIFIQLFIMGVFFIFYFIMLLFILPLVFLVEFFSLNHNLFFYKLSGVESPDIMTFLGAIIITVIYFLVGALISFMIQKLKLKKKTIKILVILFVLLILLFSLWYLI